jgi:hypothetical protein
MFDKHSYHQIIKSWADQDIPSNEEIAERMIKDRESGKVEEPTLYEVAIMLGLDDFVISGEKTYVES